MLIRYLITIPVVALLWIGTIYSNRELRDIKDSPVWQRERMSSVVNNRDAIPFLLGNESVLADVTWIKTVLYFGEHYSKDRDFQWLTSMIDATTMLNESFFPAYEFAGLMIPQLTDDWEYARKTLEIGVGRVNNRNEWILFYLSWIYYDRYQEYERAAELLSMAATSPNAPVFWGRFAATLYGKSDKVDKGVLFLYALIESTDNPQVKEELKKKIEDMEAGDF